ncbi:50S ribosomal protein L3 N(5)-glutamine methyltransferase [Idiomarina xiamenensis]|uniref:50S ribosomal protein L3 N(5)-glutamine methyltransferase n=1 Tax=Idiomarina xiamenensis TaxID=1207041 RepID=UPI00030FAAA7|nr:50S ribosomal protein L3 N(5)-glutamine methyltransferase [Idiomarina xiamenensis]
MERVYLEQAVADLATIDDYLRWGISRFNSNQVYFGHGTDNAYDEAMVLLMHVLKIEPQAIEQFRHCRLTERERVAVVELFARRIRERIPAAYLTHQAWFAGLPFYVDERVLIPRSPLAELIEQGFQPWLQQPPQRILDLCTGSACIAIACAYAFDQAEVDAVDISEDALAVAERNIEEHQLSQRVIPLQSDLFDAIRQERYDLIVSNPPYVDAEDMADLPAEYRHEPELGLAAGNDGLILVERILRQAADQLNEGGILICEVGNSMVALSQKYPQIPFTWLSFERGGDGVFLLTRDELLQAQALLRES